MMLRPSFKALPKAGKSAALAAMVFAGMWVTAGSASAGPIAVTYNPGAALLAGSIFTADKLNVLDFLRVDLGSTDSSGTGFTENGFLQLNNVSLANTSFSPSGLNSAYSLYFSFSGSGVQSAPNFSASSVGTFSALSYTLYGVAGVSTFGIDGSNNPFANSSSTPTQLATGSLISGATGFSVLSTGVSPNASVSATVSEINSAFFVSPNMTLQLAGAFNNDVNIVQVFNNSRSFDLLGGGGDVTFTSVAEPGTMFVVASGILGLLMVRRRTHQTLS